jgi:hypothetical protein
MVVFENGSFIYRGDDPIAPTEFGRAIVDALLNRERYTWFEAEPDFAVDILRHTGRTGGCDFHTQSDRFEWSIREATTLKEKANQLELMLESDDLRDSAALAERSADLGNANVYQALRASIDQLRAHAGYLYGTGGRKQIRQRYHLPELRPGNPHNDPDVIYFDPYTKTWNFGQYQVGVNKLSRIIALSLLANREVVDMGDMNVTVNYLVEMVRITGIHGRFYDVYDGAFNMFAPAGPSRNAESRL